MTLDDVLVVLQRAEMATRMGEEIERNVIELGREGRLIEMQLDRADARACRAIARALVRDYLADDSLADSDAGAGSPTCRTAGCSGSPSWPRCSGTEASTRSTRPSRRAATARWRTSRGSPTHDRRTVVEAFGGLDQLVRAPLRELEALDGVGPAQAREIREGLRRLQEHNLMDRYLQL